MADKLIFENQPVMCNVPSATSAARIKSKL